MARRKLLRAKIHRATVTHADLEYEGSVTVPPDLMAAGEFVEYEAVHVWNVTRGTRFETYAILGAEGSREISINGAAAHLAGPGDKVIIAAFVELEEEELAHYKPRLVFVDKNNRELPTRAEVPGPHTAEHHPDSAA